MSYQHRRIQLRSATAVACLRRTPILGVAQSFCVERLLYGDFMEVATGNSWPFPAVTEDMEQIGRNNSVNPWHEYQME